MKYKISIALSMMIICAYSFAQTDLIFKNGFENPVIPIFVVKLNDTGVTFGGDNSSGNNGSCVSNIISPQDCNTGRDADPLTNSETDGHAGFSFTKLGANGLALFDQSVDYATTPWSCVKDNVTGLIWEVKNDISDDIHYKNSVYKWGGVTAIGRDHQTALGAYFDDWNVLVVGSNNQSLCGLTNWRVPTVDELTGLVNQDTFSPAIDTNYFPNTIDNATAYYWSSSPHAALDSLAWEVYFWYGAEVGIIRSQQNFVRLVSTGLE